MSGGISSHFNSAGNIYTTGWRGAGSASGAGSAGGVGSSGSAGSFGNTVMGSATGSFGNWGSTGGGFSNWIDGKLRGFSEFVEDYENALYGYMLLDGNPDGVPPLDAGETHQDDDANYSEWYSENVWPGSDK